MIDMTLVVIAATEPQMEDFDRTHTGDVSSLVVIVNLEKLSLASIANHYLAQSKLPVFGLCHADMYFMEGGLQSLYDCAMTGAVCGCNGAVLGRPGYLACSDWHSDEPCPVSTLDGSSVFFRRDLGLEFDAVTFDSYHCHVEDLCLQAHARGIPVVIPRANAGHACPQVNGVGWADSFYSYKRKLIKKWPGVEFVTT